MTNWVQFVKVFSFTIYMTSYIENYRFWSNLSNFTPQNLQLLNRPLAYKWKCFDYVLIAVTSRLDALDSHKNVFQPMRIQWSSGTIKYLWQYKAVFASHLAFIHESQVGLKSKFWIAACYSVARPNFRVILSLTTYYSLANVPALLCRHLKPI